MVSLRLVGSALLAHGGVPKRDYCARHGRFRADPMTAQPLRTACRLDRDVASGELADHVFAANLDQVLLGGAPPVYGEADRFFAHTHPSGGLRQLLEEVFGRLSGARADSAPVLRLETSLGGGKTHNLIALLHAAREGFGAQPPDRFMNPALAPSPALRPNIGVFVGTSAGARSFPEVNGVTASTPWGYLCAQIGPEPYAAVRAADEAGTAPGEAELRAAFGDAPTLVMIDEIARYLVVADGHRVGQSTLGRQTVAFLMALFELAGSHPRMSVVLTTTQVTDAFGEETAKVLDLLAELAQVTSRKEHILRPSTSDDLPAILRARLFEHVDGANAGAVAAQHVEAARTWTDHGVELPEASLAPGRADEIVRCYPFHPELIEVLDRRLTTLPNFNRARGALRLLAGSLRRLWEREGADALLVHPHHIPLDDPDTVNELSSRIGYDGFERVINNDIASQGFGEPAHAATIDSGRPTPFATRIATTVYLWSLAKDSPGIAEPKILAAVLEPGDDANQARSALTRLTETAWHLHSAPETGGLRFGMEVNLTFLIQDAERQVLPTKVGERATDILEGAFSPAALTPRFLWKNAAVPDNSDQIALAIAHWSQFGDRRGVEDEGASPPPTLLQIWEQAGATGAVRTYRNRVVILAPLDEAVAPMEAAVRRSLALETLSRNRNALEALSDQSRSELDDRVNEARLTALVAVCNAMSVLYVPEAGPALRGHRLPLVTTAAVTSAGGRHNQTLAVQEHLVAIEKVLRSGDKPPSPAYFLAKAGNRLEDGLPAEEIPRIFAMLSDLKIVLDPSPLREMVRAGVVNGTWELHDTRPHAAVSWATADTPNASFDLASGVYLHTAGSAPAAESPLKEGGLGAGGGGFTFPGTSGGPTSDEAVHASGAAAFAIRQALGELRERGQKRLQRIVLEVPETDDDPRGALTRATKTIPATLPGATVRYRIAADVDLDPENGDRARLDFSGEASRWSGFATAIENALATSPGVAAVTAEVTFVESIPLTDELVEELIRRAESIGPAQCTIRLEGDAS